jgi:Protein of unknown function (DUF3467)
MKGSDMPEETEQAQPEPVITDAPEVYREYSNHINITWNAFDVRFCFGDGDSMVKTDGKRHVETKAVITVSWTQAKQIAEILAEVIRRFEAANGEIKRVTDIKPS